ncbi:MAG: chitobiase/beta-hexosaminidase C-terminal domain-containing protein [Bacteroidota bacterium]
MPLLKRTIILPVFIFFFYSSFAQVAINEGSNKNHTTIADEDNDYPDWVELFNYSADTVDLFNFSITDNLTDPQKWIFPSAKINPGEYKVIFCSKKDRKPDAGFVTVHNSGVFLPQPGWNTHTFSTPFYWDGTSNLLINICSYEGTGYTSNSVFNQTATAYPSTVYYFEDGSAAACAETVGTIVNQRPNIRLNGFQVGNGTIQNTATDYPAPYGNWYWGARHQMIIPAAELTAAGLTAGNITSLDFDVVTPDPCAYDYIEISMKLVAATAVSSQFVPLNTAQFLHTNFGIGSSGETIYLFDSAGSQISNLNIPELDVNHSYGCFPDSSAVKKYFGWPTPNASNNSSLTYNGYIASPAFSLASGVYASPQSVSIINMSGGTSIVTYTTDGSEPTVFSTQYTGTPIPITSTTVLKARAFDWGMLGSPLSAASYLIGINHTTPVISMITENNNLYGLTGIFDNWWQDWEKPAYLDYFDSTGLLIFSQRSGVQIDGGAGGSRSHPQHSMRLEMNDPVLGDGKVFYNFIPNRGTRNEFSDFYLRNGSNMYLIYPYKDAVQVQMMVGATKGYYSSWRPVTLYINGGYFGLYELREKFNAEYFQTLEGANPDSIDLLSLSYWNGGVLRPVIGSVDSFYTDYNNFNLLNTTDTGYWASADNYFDMEYYTDYIIAQSWMGNVDWPYNNIKLYRSNATNYRWRFCLIDQELSMDPAGWTDYTYDHINFMLGQSTAIPYINIWLKSMQNGKFYNYFINRFADVMNTAYLDSRLQDIDNTFFNLTADEMPNEFYRWGDSTDIPGQMLDFYMNHFTFQSQLNQRSDYVRDDIETHFNLPNQVDLTLDVIPNGAGKIHISTIEPDAYPWNGIYFNGVPVKIYAIANPGYTFSHWGNNGLITDTLNYIFLDTLQASTISFDAYFEQTNISVEELEMAEFSVYPNPANNMLYIVSKQQQSGADAYEITDLAGKIIKSGTLNPAGGKAAISVESLPVSMYFITVRQKGKGIQTIRFVKTN